MPLFSLALEVIWGEGTGVQVPLACGWWYPCQNN